MSTIQSICPVRSQPVSNNVMSYKPLQVIVYLTRKKALIKAQKSKFRIIRICPVCYTGMLVLNKNAKKKKKKKAFVAICFGFSEKISSLPLTRLVQIALDYQTILSDYRTI